MADTVAAKARAEQFEDEKRRIIESCFGKANPDGSQVESYITHIRVVEDAAHPSTPPPPNSPAENKKPRIIIVAVRKSGRVRVHKARENSNGTFSIGKTWNLDDLGPVQSYTVINPSSTREQQYKEWAGDTGFVVSLGKAYYWQASTYKEKAFFVGSLVKIYRKYTGGKSPELLGFSPQEEQELLGTSRPTTLAPLKSPGPPRTPNAFPPPAPSAGSAKFIQPYPSAGLENRAPSRNGAITPGANDGRPPTGERLRAPSREGYRAVSRESERAPSRNGPNGYGPPSANSIRAPSREGNRAPSREGFNDIRKQPSRDQMVRNQPSNDSIPRMPGGFAPPIPPVPSPSSSVTMVQPTNRSITPRSAANGAYPAPTPPPQNDETLRLLAGESIDEPAKDTNSVRSRKSSDGRRPSSPIRQATPEVVPERRRPPFPKKGSFSQKSVDSDSSTKFSTPVATPDPQRGGERRSPSRSRKPPLQQDASTRDPIPPSEYFSRSKMDEDRKQENGTPATEVSSIRSGKSGQQPPVEDKAPTTPAMEEPLTSPTDEEHRPGLGPMIKKKSAKDLAGTWRKAAVAAQAFKPRVGGAAERLLAVKDTPTSKEPDGITGVVPAPLARGGTNESSISPPPEPKEPPKPPLAERAKSPFSPQRQPKTPTITLQRKATEDMVPTQTITKPIPEVPSDRRTASPERTRSRSPGRRRRQQQEVRIVKYCGALGIDPKVLEGKGGDFDDLLTELGWNGKLDEGKTIDDLQADVRREIGRAQATGWLGHIEQQERKTQELAILFDKVVQECEELDGLLTLYQHELDTLADDVAYIEAQGQGLQVQTANQKLLQKELEKLLRTISISPSEMRDLREASLGSADGLDRAERALSILYKAMLTVDPDIRQNQKRIANGVSNKSGSSDSSDNELSQMLAVQEKRQEYREETDLFLKRFNQYMSMAFKMAEQRTTDYLEQNKAGLVAHATRLDTRIHDASRNELWMYNALMLFVRETNSYEWQTIISTYERATKSAYQEQFRENTLAWKRITRKPTGEEQDLLFSGQDKDKESDALATAARKLTVKRGKTVRVGTGRQSTGERQDGKVEPYEAFAGVIEEQTKAISEEQNFVVDFFHLSSLSTADFADVVSSARAGDRRLPNLSAKQAYDPDRDMAKMVEKTMDNLYAFWPGDLQNLTEWTLKNDQLQGVGLLYSLEKRIADFEETNQEYATRALQKLHEKLIGLFHRFVDEQIKSIEETKVKIKKRRGVISFMRVFPGFMSAVEGMLPEAASNIGNNEPLEIRSIVNEAYAKINKAMFESLNFIAKENPGASGQAPGGTGAVSGDPEDKEALNYHILMIENMHHYVEEVENKNNVVLEEWRQKAEHEYLHHMKQYVDSVIRRPLGKLLDFIESTESLINSSEGNYASIASRPSHSKNTARKIISSYDLKEIKKGVETLKKRVEKHFGDADDPGVGKSLVVKVYGECSAKYGDAHERLKIIIDKVYDGQASGLELEWRKEEVTAMFRR